MYWGAADTNLDKLARVQQQAHNMFDQLPVSSLEHRREAAAVGLTCKLLHGGTKAPLLSLTPEFEDPKKEKLRRSARTATVKVHNHQLQTCVNARSLQVYRRSYKSRIPEIWNHLGSECLQGDRQDWKAYKKQLQKYVCK